jgi:hypothetical protein
MYNRATTVTLSKMTNSLKLTPAFYMQKAKIEAEINFIHNEIDRMFDNLGMSSSSQIEMECYIGSDQRIVCRPIVDTC